MKFKIPKNVLVNVLSQLNGFGEKKDASHITSHILLEVNQTGVWFHASNHLSGIKMFAPATVEAMGDTTVNYALFSNAINKLGEFISIELQKDTVIVKSGSSRLKFNTFDADSFPQFRPVKAEETAIDRGVILNARLVSFSADTNNPKKCMDGVHLGKYIAASDTRMMSLVKNNGAAYDIILPKASLSKIANFQESYFYTDGTNIVSKSANHFMYFRLISDKYPNVERIMREHFKHSVVLDKSKLKKSLDLCAVAWHEVFLKFNDGEVELVSADTERSINTSFELRCDFELTVCLNIGFLQQFISNTTGNEFTMKIEDENLAVCCESGTLSSYMQVVIV